MAKKTKLWILVSVIAVVLAAAVTAGAIFLPGILGWDRSPADPYVKWYSEDETEYVITTVDQLYDLAYLSSKYDFEDQTFLLGCDIVINDGNAADWLEAGPARLWYPINGFAGTFDGQGHTISGLYGVSYNDYMGLFSNTSRKAIVKNLKVTNTLLKTSSQHGTGVISANGGGTFENIYTDAIIIADNWNVGGIIGKIDANGDSLISNCWFDGQMLLKSDQGRVAGGMVGDIMMSNGIVTIEHCLSTGYFTSPAITNTSRGRLMDIGGIVGRASSGTTNITDCFAAGKFDVDCTNGTGIIIGSAGKGTTNISHTYSDNETYVNAIGYRYNKTVGDVYRYNAKFLNGYEAYKWTTLDFEEYWAVDLDGTPVLKYFVDEVPSLEGIEREIDTSWYTKIKTYTIKNWKQLLGLHVVSQWDNMSGKIINLGADIVINEGDASEWRENAPEITWMGIGSTTVNFAGTFDGCGHSVSGAYRKYAGNGVGFFPAVGEGGVVRNFRLLNSYFESNGVAEGKGNYSYTASIAAYARGATFDTVYSNAIIVTDGYQGGGLVGMFRNGNASIVTNCWFDGEVHMHGEQGMRGGGLVGVVWNTTLNMSHCLMTGVMTGESKAWGANEGIMVGYPNAAAIVNIEDSLNVGSLTVYEGKADGNGMMCGRIAADAAVTFDGVFSIKGKNDGNYISDWGLTGYRTAEPIFAGPAVIMDSKYLRGYAAYQYTDLDFENYWAVDPYGYPKLQSFMGEDETAPDVSGFGRLVDYTWYNAESDYYYISNRKQLMGLSFLASSLTFKDKYINITNDIAINSGDATTWGETPPAVEWLPIGNATNMFMGTFNGGGHTISGIYVKEPTNCIGLFATVREGTVKNLRLTNSYIESNMCADTLAKGKYTNYNYIGAIASYAYDSTFDTIYTDAILKNDGEYTGGIVGLVNKTGNTVNINNCWYDGTIIQDFTIPKKDGSIGAAFAGGIIGLLRNSNANITHCLSTATLTHINLADGAWGTVTGGIVGRFDSNDPTRNDTLTIKDTLGAPDFQMPMSTQGGNGSVISQVNPNTRLVLEKVYGTGGWNPIATNRTNELNNGERRDETDPGTVGKADNVQLPRMIGANALLFSELDFDKYWVAIEGTTPQLKSFATGKEANKKDAIDDRIPDISWYDSEKTEFVIKNTAQMRGFAELSKTKDFAGQTIKLGADIAFNYGMNYASMLAGAVVPEGVDAWTPIGTKITPFRGVFDGQGHTVSGLTNSNTGHSALFAYTDDAFIQNVTIDRSVFRGGSGGGTSAGVVANTTGDTTIRNVKVTKDVRLYIATYNAGIVAYNSGNLVMDNVWSEAYTNPQWAGNAFVGGILGANANISGIKVSISNALYTGEMAGTVAGESFVGGIIGASMNSPITTITDSLAAGKIQVVHGGETGQMYAGAVIGSKSWTEGNTTFEDVYATTECFPVCEVVDGVLAETGEYYGLIREDQTITGATQVDTAKLLGDKAKKNAPGLDYKKVWTTVEGKTPELRNPASGLKTPKPITTPNKTPVDMTWYNTKDKVFVMKDIADLNGLSLLSQTNTFEGITIKLGADMKLNKGDASDWAEKAPDNKWVPIGNVSYRFKGTFDGQGKTISGLYLVDNGTDGGSAMFGCIDGATIKNFKLTNSYIKDSTTMTDSQVWGRVGSIVGTAYSGTVENIYSDANISGAAMFNGGIVALYRAPRVAGAIVESNLVIKNCWYNGTIDLGTNGRSAGGILGGSTDGLSDNVDQTKLTIENCLFSGEITGSFNGAEPCIGGVFGRMINTNAVITDCLVTGSLNVNTIKYVGSAYGYKNYGVKIAITDLYVCEESSHVAYIGVAHNTTNAQVANIVTVKRADILGDAAKEKLTGLDFKKVWSVKKENTPVLKAFDDETPMEPVQIPDAPSLKPDTSWYNNTDTEFVITTPEQLLGLAELSRINTFAGKTIKLGADIIFNEGVSNGNLLDGTGKPIFGVQGWTPIGSNVMPFKGVFDGMGHKVAGLAAGAGHASLFAYVEDAFVQNVTIERSTFKGGSGGTSAGVVANAGGDTTVKRVYITGSVNLYGATNIGGIIGKTYGTGTVTVDNVLANHYVNPQWIGNGFVGGIVGSNSNTELKLNISNALYTGRMAGTVAGESFVGGLIGASMNNPVTTVTDSLAAGNILILHGGATGKMYAGSVIGSKSWTEENTVMKDVYATENCFPVATVVDGNVAATEENYGTVREDQSFASGVKVVKTENILGELAKKNAPGLDYKKVWMTVEENIPTLRNPASGEPTPKPITKVENTEVDISWYDATKTEFVLMDAADLNGFALLSQDKTFEGVTIKLGADIVLNTGDAETWKTTAPQNSWTPVGSVTYRFKGVFDGQGHTISGLYVVDSASDGGQAMFSCIDGATIKNFKLVNSYFASSQKMEDAQVWGRVGSIVGTAYSGTVENVYSDADLSGAAMFNGGIVALYRAPRANGTIVESDLVIKNCWYNGTIDLGTNGRSAGGILGGSTDGLSDNVEQTKLTIENCLFTGEITGSFNGAEPCIGGIFGRAVNTNAVVTDCLVTGSLNVNTIKYTGSAYGYKNYGVKIAITDLYVAEESAHVAYIGVEHNTSGATIANIVTVKRADILGDAAKEKLTGLDFAEIWTVVEDNVPVLKAFADQTPMEPVQIPDAPSIKPDTSWYNNTDTEFVITTPAQLLGLAELSRINTFAGKTIKLGADIIFNEGVANGNLLDGTGKPIFGVQGWTPIGSNVMPFKGVFDGMGHKIAGLAAGAGHASLFAYVEDAFVQNVTIERSTFKGGSGGTSAGVVANAGGDTTVKRVYITGSVNLYGATNIGGIIGKTYGTGTVTVDNVWANHYVNPQWIGNSFVGGIVGSNTNTELKLNISNALYTGRMAGTVAGESFVGGLIGASMNNPVTTVTDSLAAGNILVQHGGATGAIYAGSLIGSKSWTEENTVMKDVYATENCFPVPAVVDGNLAATEDNYGPVREDQTFASGVKVVKTEDILGELAKTNASGLDYVDIWMTVVEDVPHLQNPASGEPTPEPSTEVENTEVDISWYDADKTEFVLMDAADLNGFALLSQDRTFEGKTIKLGADIALNTGDAETWKTTAPSSKWTPVGSVTYRFKGIFDGQGHTISGLYVVDSASDGGQAMFSCIDGATIKNFKLTNSYFASSQKMEDAQVWGRVGSIVGTAYSGTVENVYSDADLSGAAMFNGGIVALYRAPKVSGAVVESDLVIKNCWYNGTIDLGTNGRSAGGILGGATDGLATSVDLTKMTIENCLFTGEITGSFNGAEPCIGGIFGRVTNASATITDCLVTGSLNVNTIKYTGSAYGYKNYGVKIAITDLYVCEESAHVAYLGVDHNTSGANVANIVTVKRADILGDAAKEKLTGLDFAQIWTVLENNVPVLKAFADQTPMEPVQIPDPPALTPDTSWYNTTDKEFVITTPEQLLGMAELSKTKDFAGQTIKLGADIIFNEGITNGNLISGSNVIFGVQRWTAIGTKLTPFRGVFDGQGHKIAGLAETGTGQSGLFAYVEDAFVQNVTIERSVFRGGSGGGKTAALIANAGGNTTVKRVYITGSVNLFLGTYSGAIIAQTYGTGTITVDNVWSNGYTNPQWASGAFVGGLIGANSNTAGLKLNLSNVLYTGRMEGTVSGESFVGGLIGASLNSPVTTITDSLAAGSIKVVHGGATGKMYAGSLIGSKSWTDANTVMTDVYATENCFPVCEVVDGALSATDTNYGAIREDQSFASGVTIVKTEDILGELAKTNASGLDYVDVWMTVEEDVPHLQNPASGEPTPEPITEADTTPVDYSWYDANEDTYILMDAADLNGFARLAMSNTFEGKTVKLGADIVLNTGDAATWATVPPAYKWAAIGTADSRFKGTFDGQGHTISGLYATNDSGWLALFGCIDGATIKNFKLVNSYLKSNDKMGTDLAWSNMASIVSVAYAGTISDIYTDAYISGGAMYNGGIVGLYRAPKASGAVVASELTISNCWFDGELDLGTSGRSSGGILGGITEGANSATTLSLENVLMTGRIHTDYVGEIDSAITHIKLSAVGGLFGNIQNAKINISDVLVAGEMDVVDGATYAGSIHGYKNWGVAIGAVSDFYVTEETYSQHFYNNPSNAHNGAAWAQTKVKAAKLLGGLARLYATGLDFSATGKWIAVKDAMPELRDFSTGVEAPVIDEDPDAPKSIKPNTDWYNDTDTEFVIDTIEELFGFAKLTNDGNSFAGKTVKLGADLTLNTGNAADWATTAPTYSWTPIAKTTFFEGTFDGQGHTISGLYAKNEDNSYAAFIAMAKAATVKNFKVVNTYFEAVVSGTLNNTTHFHAIPAIVGRANKGTLVEGIYTDAILVGGRSAGLVGHGDDTASVGINIKNCWFAGSIDVNVTIANVNDGRGFGGILGQAVNAQTTTLENCLFTGTITGGKEFTSIGGLVGSGPWNATVKMTNCLSAGNMSGVTAGTVGSVIGNNPSSNKATYTAVYATADTYTALAGANGTLSNFTATAVAKADILGGLARWNLSGFDFSATGAWIAVEDKIPELRTFSTATDAPAVPNPVAPPTDPNEEDTTWYDPTQTEYVLDTIGKLKGFVTLAKTNNFAGKTVKLGADLAWNTGDAATYATTAPANVWTPIGTTSMKFKGIFDGQNYTISGLYFDNQTGSASVGMFAAVEGATIKNLKVTNSYVKSTAGSAYVGILVGTASGVTVENVYIGDDVTAANGVYSGVVAYADGANAVTFKQVWMNGTITSGMWRIRTAGLLGSTANTNGLVVTIEDCLFTGTVAHTHATTTDENYAGGFAGGITADVKITVKNSLSAGTITVATTSANTLGGSLVGVASWRGAAYTTFENAYATTECHANVTYRAASTYTGTPVQVAKAEILGDLATSKLTGLDFTNTWTTVEAYVPVLKAFVAFAPEPPVGPDPSATVNGIEVTAPTKTQYNIGESLVLDGMVVTATYTDTTTKILTEGYTVSALDSSTAGTKTITVTYGTFTDTFEVTVIDQAPVDPDKETTDWYDDSKTEFTLTTVGQLKGLVTLSKTNTFAGKTIKLGADIVWNTGDAADWATTAPANVWNSIGNGDNGFTGTFDGQGHTISGLYYNGTSYAALIGRLYGTGKLMNVKVVNSYLKSTATGSDGFHHSSGIVGRFNNGATITGVYTDAILVADKCAGLVGFNDGGDINISNCWFNGTIDASTAANAAGIIASVVNNKTHTITNCLFTGTITGGKSGAYIGGLVGIGPYGATIKATDCLVAGDMTGVTAGTVGSVIGNNPGGNKSVYTDVYVTNETHTNLKGAGGATFPVTAIAAADLKGEAAKTTVSGLDFTNAWTTVTNGKIPVLKGFEDFAPTEAADIQALDTSWYNDTDTTFTLTTPGQLKGLSQLAETNNFKGKTIKLGANITLNSGDASTWGTTAPEYTWNPIGKEDASLAFEGTFDGQGNTISGLYYDSALYGGGLFTYTGENAVIKNVKLDNSYIKSTHATEWSATAGIAAFVNGTDFYNVTSNVIIDADSGFVGGIAGRLQGKAATFEKCSFGGTITGTGTAANYYGGITGGHNTNVAGATTYKDCSVSGTVSTTGAYIGGLAGRSSGAAGSTTTVDGFTLTGTISTNNSSASFAGGMFGLAEVSTLTIKNVTTGGKVVGNPGIAGGFIGRVSTADVTIDNCTFSGTIDGGTKLGGFVGQVFTADKTTTVKNSTFSGTITATNSAESTVAGIAANVNNGNLTVKDSVVKGTLVAPGPYAAGVVAQVMNVAGSKLNIDGVIATTDIQCASSNAGGIVGRLMGTSIDATVTNCLAKVTFTTDSWATAQIIAHAQGNAVKIENNFFVQTANSAAAGIESSGGNVTNNPVKVTEAVWNYLKSCYEMGIKPDYDGFEDASFVIMDVADLYGFNVYNQVNGFAGKTAKLGADITINTLEEGKTAADWATKAPKYNWAPVGTIGGAIGAFAGTFDGQGHTISGLYCAFTGGNSLGMFREVTGTVTNFKLVDSYLVNTAESNWGYNGGITASLAGGTISKVYTNAIVETIDSYAGGIVGMTTGATATVTECQFDGVLKARCVLSGDCGLTSGVSRAHANFVGGIIGAAIATNTNVNDSIFSGTIYNQCHSSHRTGGILGGPTASGKNVTVLRCFSIGKFCTLGHTNNSYHFSMIMDCRADGNGNVLPTNMVTLYVDNYVLATPAYQEDGTTTINSGSNVTGANGGSGSTVRYTEEQMIERVKTEKEAGTSNLDFTNVWVYEEGKLPTLKAFVANG